MTLAEPQVPDSYDREPVSPELRPLLLAVYQQLKDQPADIPGLGASLLKLLSFLASPGGRTNANCQVAGSFFLLGQGWAIEGWDHVPEPLGDIIAEIGMSLHDTVSTRRQRRISTARLNSYSFGFGAPWRHWVPPNQRLQRAGACGSMVVWLDS